MRGRGGGEGGLGTISSELLLWVSMARERRRAVRDPGHHPQHSTRPPGLQVSPRSLSQLPQGCQMSNPGAGAVLGELALPSQTASDASSTPSVLPPSPGPHLENQKHHIINQIRMWMCLYWVGARC